MSYGYSNREVGRALAVSEGTVKNHVSSILGKLGVKDRTRAVLKGLQMGLLCLSCMCLCGLLASII